MPDDIVTRLREVADSEVYRADISVSKLYEAIDEIERLRAKLQRWEDCEMVVESLCGWDSEETYCDKCKEAYEEMMVNE